MAADSPKTLTPFFALARHRVATLQGAICAALAFKPADARFLDGNIIRRPHPPLWCITTEPARKKKTNVRLWASSLANSFSTGHTTRRFESRATAQASPHASPWLPSQHNR
jgi:hypothetical protein